MKSQSISAFVPTGACSFKLRKAFLNSSMSRSRFPKWQVAKSIRARTMAMNFDVPSDAVHINEKDGLAHLVSDIDLSQPYLLELFVCVNDEFSDYLLPYGSGSYAVSDEKTLLTLINLCKSPQRKVLGIEAEGAKMLAPVFGYVKYDEASSTTSQQGDEVDDTAPFLKQIGCLALATTLNQAAEGAPIIFSYQGIQRFVIVQLLGYIEDPASAAANLLKVNPNDENVPQAAKPIWALVEPVCDDPNAMASDELQNNLVNALRKFFGLNKKLGEMLGAAGDILDFGSEVSQFESLLEKMLKRESELVSKSFLQESLSFFACDQLEIGAKKRLDLLSSRNTSDRFKFALDGLNKMIQEMTRSFEDYKKEQAEAAKSKDTNMFG